MAATPSDWFRPDVELGRGQVSVVPNGQWTIRGDDLRLSVVPEWMLWNPMVFLAVLADSVLMVDQQPDWLMHFGLRISRFPGVPADCPVGFFSGIPDYFLSRPTIAWIDR